MPKPVEPPVRSEVQRGISALWALFVNRDRTDGKKNGGVETAISIATATVAKRRNVKARHGSAGKAGNEPSPEGTALIIEAQNNGGLLIEVRPYFETLITSLKTPPDPPSAVRSNSN